MGTFLDAEATEVFRKRILALRERPSMPRRRALTGMFWENLTYKAFNEAEMFGFVYGDPMGRQYWSEYLADHLTLSFFAHLLAVHSTTCEKLKEWKSGVAGSIEIVNENLINEGQRRIVFPPGAHESEIDKGPKVHASAAIRELLARHREHLLPRSLISTLAYQQSRTDRHEDPAALEAKAKQNLTARPDSKLGPAINALKVLYSDGPPTSVDREEMRKAVSARMGKTISVKTLDRARHKAWPA